MKIGYDAKRYFQNMTGLGNYSRSLIDNYAKFYPENPLYLYTPSPIGAPEKTRHEFTIKTPDSKVGRIRGNLWRSFGIAGSLQNDQIDIYHGLSNEIPFGLSKNKSFCLVVTIHDLIFLRYPRFYHLSERLIYLQKFKYACQHSDFIIAISEQTKRDIIEYFNIDAGKIKTVYQGFNPIFCRTVSETEKQSVIQKYNLPKTFILYVGTLNERKNALRLVEALDALPSDLDPYLVLIGNGKAYKRKIENFIDRNRLTNRVSILSGIPTEDLPALYQAASLFVYPSYYEGFGIPVIEALSSGVPVITSKVSCLPEAGGPSSCYIDPLDSEDIANKIERILTDRLLAEKMVVEGKKYSERFGEEQTTKDLHLFYTSITS